MKSFENHPWPLGIQPAAAYADETRRLAVLDSYATSSWDDDPELVAITQFAARLCEAPVALVSLVESERQRFLAREGIEERETPRDVSFCSHAMQLGGLMEVRDTTDDPRFVENPLVTGEHHVRFYAGQALISDEGAALGTLCVIDTKPRPAGLTDMQRQGLAVLAQAVMRRLRSRREGLAARRNLQRSEAQLRALVDSMPAMAWSCDGSGNVDYVNRRLMEFIGLGNSMDDGVVHPDDLAESDRKWRESLRTGESYEAEYRLRRADGGYRWMLARAEPVRDEDGNIVRWFSTATDIDDVHKMSESRDLLARELSHRIKNIFAVVSGLVSLSIRRQPEHKAFGDDLIATIRALGRAHDYVRPSEGHRSSSLHGMLNDLFQPYGAGEHSRVALSGDDSALAARAATPLALVFHELATNSAKYGALSADEGLVTLDITDKGDKLLLRWEEHGGPPPTGEVLNEGFGSRLVEMSVTGQLGGSWDRRFEEEGLVCELTVSKAAIKP